jgi:hypothetical protein
VVDISLLSGAACLCPFADNVSCICFSNLDFFTSGLNLIFEKNPSVFCFYYINFISADVILDLSCFLIAHISRPVNKVGKILRLFKNTVNDSPDLEKL